MSPKYDEIQKDCEFKTYQDQKCVHDKNKYFRKIGSCTEDNCPLKKEAPVPAEKPINRNFSKS